MSDKHLLSDEAPISPTEERLARFQDDALQRLQQGQSVDVAALLSDRPDLIEPAQRLFPDLKALRDLVRASDFSPETLATPSGPLAYPDPFPGEFRIIDELGEGSFGKVWLAEDLKLGGRKVALKTLRHVCGSEKARLQLQALAKEAGFLGSIRHPNVVQVHAWRASGDAAYLVLEYVEGGSLASVLVREGPLPWERATRYAADIADGLAAAHKAGVVHRDVKPDNILLDKARDEAKLTDFGVSARLAEAKTSIGTVVYMAPEALAGKASELSDVYSLAATLYTLLTGAIPSGGGRDIGDPNFRAVPEVIEQVVRSGMADHSNRPPLHRFREMLRGALNQTLPDTFLPPTEPLGGTTPFGLRLVVARLAGLVWTPAATTQSVVGASRDIKKVPPKPGLVRVRTGEPLRITVESDRDGYVVVFNVGPTGNLNLLYPEVPRLAGSPPDVCAGRPLDVMELELQPPVGRERLFAVWSKEPLPVSETELRSLSESPGVMTRAYGASRDIVRVRQAVQQSPAGACRVVGLELEHA